MILNSNNIEDLVLRNSGLLNKLPHLKSYCDQWKLGQMIPALRVTGQKAKLKLLNSLTQEDLKIIQEYLKFDTLLLETLEYSKIKNHTTKIQDTENWLNNNNWLFDDFCISRDEDQLYICTWR